MGSEDQAQVTGPDEESFPTEPFHHPTFIVLKKGYLDISNIKNFELVQFTISTKKRHHLIKMPLIWGFFNVAILP